jgi:uncharacterized protein YcnI
MATLPVAVLVAAVPASAHVTVHSDDAVKGATDTVLSFRTPNERSDATTVELRIFLPTATPLLGVLVQPIPGWHFSVRSVTLRKPIATDDGAITSAVSSVTWRGGNIPVGGYQDFDIDVGALPSDVSSLTFKALQTYSNGTVVRWIETAPAGSPEPDRPAPVLHLADRQVARAAQPSSDARNDGRYIGIAALALAIVALWLAVADRVRRVPRRR